METLKVGGMGSLSKFHRFLRFGLLSRDAFPKSKSLLSKQGLFKTRWKVNLTGVRVTTRSAVPSVRRKQSFPSLLLSLWRSNRSGCNSHLLIIGPILCMFTRR